MRTVHAVGTGGSRGVLWGVILWCVAGSTAMGDAGGTGSETVVLPRSTATEALFSPDDDTSDGVVIISPRLVGATAEKAGAGDVSWDYTGPQTIPDGPEGAWVGVNCNEPTTVPSGALVTQVAVHHVITHPYIGDLEVAVSNADHSWTVRDNDGGGTANVDETRTAESLFDGDNPTQVWYYRVRDTSGGDTGTLDAMQLYVYYEYGFSGPDLTPFQRSTWNDKIPIGLTQLAAEDTHDYTGPYPAGETLYFNWASMNNGDATATGYAVHMEVTGTGGGSWDWSDLTSEAGTFRRLNNDEGVGPLAPGAHTFKLWVDYLSAVAESNESNNYYERTITVTESGDPDIRIEPTTLTFDFTGGKTLSPETPSKDLSTESYDVRALDVLDPDAELGEVAADEIVVRFRATAAARIHTERFSTYHDDVTAWAPPGAKSGTDGLPMTVTGLRPFRSGTAKAREVIVKDADIGGALAKKSSFTAGQWTKAVEDLSAEADAKGPIGLFHAKLADGADLRQACADLMARDDVAYAHPSPVCRPTAVPNDPLYSRMWNLTRIGMPSAWDDSGNALGSVRVCVVDTGVRITHAELSGRVVSPADVYTPNGDAYADSDPDNDDPAGHGTKCAGIIAAIRDNSSAVAGIAPVTIIPVNGAKEQDGSYLIMNYTDGVYWGVDHGASVISLSLGSEHTAPYQSELDAADYAEDHGVLVCAASGNSDTNADNHYPSAIPYYISVAAVDDDDLRVTQPKWWWGSNYGSTVDICAPGQGAVGSLSDSILTIGRGSDSETSNTFNGTSAATPHVAALCALIKHVNGALTAAEIRNIVESTAQDQVGASTEDVAGWDQYHGHGLIDAAAAISLALGGDGNSLTISNDGYGTLTVSSLALDSAAAWITWSPQAPFDVTPSGSQIVTISVDFTQAPTGTTTRQLVISSNDSDENPYPGGVSIVVQKPASAQADLTPYQRSTWNDRIPIGVTQLAAEDTHSYSGPYTTDQVLYFNWASKNVGDATAAAYTVRAEVTGDGGGSWTWTSITTEPGHFQRLDSDKAVGPLAAGQHTFKVWVDDTGLVTESNESNNYYERTITVTSPGSADLVPHAPSHWDERIPIGVKALTGDATHVYSGPYSSTQTLYINWASSNTGDATATNYTVHIEATGTGCGSWDWSGLNTEAGNYTYLTNDFSVGPLAEGEHTFKLWVDYGDNVSESDETDNYFERTITVGAEPGLTVTLDPAAARTVGAQWRVDGGAWQDSGTTQTGLSEGQHTVSFKDVTDWTTPASQQVTITSGQTTSTTGTYLCQAPAAPQNVAASDGAYSDRVEITWSAVSGVGIEYQVLRGVTATATSMTAISDWLTDTSYSDTTAAPPTVVPGASGGCGSPGAASTVSYNYYQYRVVARRDTGCEGAASLADRGYRGGGKAAVYEKVLPGALAFDEVRAAGALSPLAVRLRSDERIDEASVSGYVAWDGYETTDVVWHPLDDEQGNDGWAVYTPAAPWALGTWITMTASATTVSGAALGPISYEFVVEPEATTKEVVLQPNVALLGQEGPDATGAGCVAVWTGEPLPDFWEGRGVICAIEPDEAYNAPRRIWLPLPDGLAASDAAVYYYYDGGLDDGWYRGENVAGWLADGDFLVAEVGGRTYLGLSVRHGAVVRLGVSERQDVSQAASVAPFFGRGIGDLLAVILTMLALALSRRAARRCSAHFAKSLR